MKHNMKSIIYR